MAIRKGRIQEHSGVSCPFFDMFHSWGTFDTLKIDTSNVHNMTIAGDVHYFSVFAFKKVNL